jgi:hypothetical protein
MAKIEADYNNCVLWPYFDRYLKGATLSCQPNTEAHLPTERTVPTWGRADETYAGCAAFLAYLIVTLRYLTVGGKCAHKANSKREAELGETHGEELKVAEGSVGNMPE